MAFYSRKPTRIPGYDYAKAGYYFVTICTHNKKCIFGTRQQLNAWGKIAEQDLKEIPLHFSNIRIDAYIIMPNHIHAIVIIEQDDITSLSQIVGLYKSGVSRKIRKMEPEAIIWQRSYYDHMIRNQAEYEKIWEYVIYNRQKWEADCYYPQAAKE